MPRSTGAPPRGKVYIRYGFRAQQFRLDCVLIIPVDFSHLSIPVLLPLRMRRAFSSVHVHEFVPIIWWYGRIEAGIIAAVHRRVCNCDVSFLATGVSAVHCRSGLVLGYLLCRRTSQP